MIRRIRHGAALSFLTLALTLLLILSGHREVTGQGSTDPNQIFEKVGSYIEFHYWPEALAELSRIAQEHANTEIEAMARQRLAIGIQRYYSERTIGQRSDPKVPFPLDEATRNEVLAQYQRIREGFPGTAYAVRAEMGIIAHTSARGLERDNLERSYLLSVTGVDCLDVLNGKRKRIVSIPAGGYYDELSATFYGVCESLYFEQRESFPNGRRNLVRFMRENFPLNSLSSIQDLRMSLLADPPLLDNLPDITPTVRIMSPRPHKARGPRPRFRIETVVGDYRYRQVDLDRIRLSVNGFDLVPYLKVGCRINPNPRLGKPFERLRLEARFPHALAPGHYQAHLVVPTIGNEDAFPGTAELTWSFSVRGNFDQDDEQEGWCDENPDDEP